MVVLGLLACAADPEDSGPVATDSDPPTTEAPSWLDLQAETACGAPVPLAYRDMALEWGLSGLDNPDGDHLNGGGAAVADFDSDGDLDVLLAYAGFPLYLYRWDGAAFAPESFTMRLLRDTGGVFPVDIEGDGDLDVVVGGATAGYSFMRNDGTSLTEEPLFIPEEVPRDGMYGAAMADADADGDVDVYLPLYGMSVPERGDVLLRNDEGVLAVGDALPYSEGAKTYQAVWFDADADGDLDAYATNDQGNQSGGNALMLNDGTGVLTPTPSECAPETSGMSVDAADVNGDGFADLYLGNSDYGNLFYADGNGSFYDVAQAYGALNAVAEADPDMVWGVALFDAENDGDIDIFAAHGDLYSPRDPQSALVDAADSLLLQGPEGGFSEDAPTLGLDTVESSRAVVPADFNGDGVLDLLVTGIVTEPHLWVSEGCTAGSWLDVRLVGTTDNRHGIGAKVEIEAGGRTFTSWVTSSASLFSGREPWVHVGLGEVATVDRLTITWPSGDVQSTEFPFAPRRRIVVTQE
ncbi:hypothetical protein LBMAG42_38540 [Deltaproteobacteria bacterium]|nr:hypothetical protein LBMAG42_38540 [Deltaproteobacteria bacterium]